MDSTKRHSKKFFTVEEANQRLPLVRAVVDDIVRLFRDVHERRQRLAEIREIPGAELRSNDDAYSEELDQAERKLDKDIIQLEEHVDELKELEIELKDPIMGLIDFPTIIDGREAYLCWKLGEKEVAFWHDLDAGFRGRQALLETPVSIDDEESSGDL